MTHSHIESYAAILVITSPENNSQNFSNHKQASSLMESVNRSTCAQTLSPEEAAKDDHRLLAFDAQRYVQYHRLEEVGNVLDNATVFLEYLERIEADPVMRLQAAIRHGFSDSLEFDKYLANIEHLMKSIQQAALNVLVQNGMEALESDPKYWNKWFEHLQRTSGDWFSEWSSDRPPLNSTMPWNIKPSLVVLWGVCWMFYTPNKSANSSRHTPEESWYSPNPNADWISQTSVATSGQTIAYSTPADTTTFQHREPLLSHTTALSRQSSSSRLGNSASPGIDMIGQINPGGYTQDTTMTQGSSVRNHMNPQTNNYVAQTQRQFSEQATSRQDLQKPTTTSTAGIRSPLTTATISPHTGSSDLGANSFATPTNVWSPLPNQNQQNRYISHNGIWSQPNFSDDISTRTTYSSSTPLNSHTVSSITNTSPSPGYYQTSGYGGLQQGYYGQNLLSGFSMPSTQGYPMSPHSLASEREPSLAPVGIARQRSHSNLTDRSTSLDNTPGSRRDSIISTEPPRDHYGNMTCNHPKCAQDPPTFARKCEWKKHKDTHTRPYVCKVPGCEKIQGFTYSGGLLRHEREVHHQHGGPKLPRYCPHKDCKRSTGQGFSRKENLNEHLRRVHRGIGIENTNSSTTKSEPPQSPSMSNIILQSQRIVSDQLAGRKRRRDAFSDEGDHLSPPLPGMVDLMQTVAELREEVQHLRQEVTVRDSKISQLQHALHLQTGGR